MGVRGRPSSHPRTCWWSKSRNNVLFIVIQGRKRRKKGEDGEKEQEDEGEEDGDGDGDGEGDRDEGDGEREWMKKARRLYNQLPDFQQKDQIWSSFLSSLS